MGMRDHLGCGREEVRPGRTSGRELFGYSPGALPDANCCYSLHFLFFPL